MAPMIAQAVNGSVTIGAVNEGAQRAIPELPAQQQVRHGLAVQPPPAGAHGEQVAAGVLDTAKDCAVGQRRSKVMVKVTAKGVASISSFELTRNAVTAIACDAKISVGEDDDVVRVKVCVGEIE